ncbi:MAG: hypothetical protein AVDCRST_MAG96-822 [uncultured Segetibacter sp.]|uniref:Uncharacterized protein n=1 Tax=uncultured Segetibacter sp. TaxID=481133 RepID=A0A6J4RUI0_9BACT|nr:MAG: hypothetical protein AVDCRST_MAG96-822 [uncultured Segetibacter sp.]
MFADLRFICNTIVKPGNYIMFIYFLAPFVIDKMSNGASQR